MRDFIQTTKRSVGTSPQLGVRFKFGVIEGDGAESSTLGLCGSVCVMDGVCVYIWILLHPCINTPGPCTGTAQAVPLLPPGRHTCTNTAGNVNVRERNTALAPTGDAIIKP